MIEAGQSAVLRTFGLRKRFGRVEAVAGLNLTVIEGSIYGFLGRNGAGKTTTIRMMMGILAPDNGALEVFGHRKRRVSIEDKRSIGYMSQGQHFYPWMTCRSIGEFAGGFYPAWDPQEFARLLQALDLPAERKISALSHGMKVKLALALALAHRPRLLILDEPTGGLDPVARREFLALVQQQARSHERTTFFSSHLVDEVERIADRVGILENGRLRYEGDLSALRASVRRIAVNVPLPPQFEKLALDADGQSIIARAVPAEWDAIEAEKVTQLSLEDIFIALTGGLKARL